MYNILYENLTYLGIILVCFINVIYIVTGMGNSSLRVYRKLTVEEKKLYDLPKVKMMQILFILSMVIVTVLAFLFTEIYTDIIDPKIFIVCYLVEIVVLTIFSHTKWILNWFCMKK